GYATCHWCHVMEHESFESEEIAQLMNEAFVCIKVDREERPDVDNIYMTVCQMMTGQGGWPLNIVMTPAKKPFHAATYIPPEQRFGRIGMKQLIPRISHAWQNQRETVMESAGQITGVLKKQSEQDLSSELDVPLLLKNGFSDLMSQYDSQKGGFGKEPKFPTPHRLLFLMQYGSPEGIQATEHTLTEMSKGGIFDQVGFGFHRYSTDSNWLLPHFEKMLYDQALLTLAYTEAYELTQKPLYRQIAEEILEYVIRDMTAPEGGFYSAEDADSEGEEGLFYIWSSDQLKSILGGEYDFISEIWNIHENGNFKDEASGKRNPNNIPHLSDLPSHEDAQRLSESRQKLFLVRNKRIHPLKDTKILTDWNGLMIAAFSKAGRVFGNEKYIRTAIQSVAFIESELRMESGGLWHRWWDGHTAVPGHLEDYAFLIFGLIELYGVTFDLEYLEAALSYNEILDSLFYDDKNGGYFMTADNTEDLIVRPKEFYDGAIPSGNSVQMLNLLKLARLTGKTEFESRASDIALSCSQTINRSPSNYAHMLTAMNFIQGDSEEIVVVGEQECDQTQLMVKYINSIYNPKRVVLMKNSKNSDRLAKLAPFTKDQGEIDNRPTVYICRNSSCEQPINTLEHLKERF
ncbi:MAG TPA: thioredoxin domain-containing protein, partial [Pontiella sp.]